MNKTIKFLISLLLINNSLISQDITKKIDSIIKSNYANNPTVGISVGFIKNNVDYYTAYGKLNKESKINIDKFSIFEIASITKILTSNLLAQAVLENKIKLDNYMDSYLPKEFILSQNLKNKIKLSDLASHQSGLPDLDFGKLIKLNPQQPVNSVTIDTLTSIINNCSELIDYGKYRYSTIGYTLLGQILEKIYDESYDKILRKKILNPLQMSNTLTRNFNVKNKTTGYNPNAGAQEYFKWNITASAGLVKSNAADMVTYLKAILTNDNPISKAAVLTERVFYKDKNREMGLATSINTDDKNTYYLKSGDSMGQSSIICYNRVQNWGIIILLTQRNSKMRQNLLDEIYDKVLK